MKIPDYNKKIKHPTYLEMLEEIERLHSIIKEVREYIEKASDNEYSYGDYEIHYEVKKELLEILDKLNKEE